jgi:ATP-dependent Clp protease ATP-binding subunit ClpC
MFERYTEIARHVIFSARYDASQSGSPFIETEHLLLGLLREDRTLAETFFGSPNALAEVWKKMELSSNKSSAAVDLPLSKAGKLVLAAAANEADRLSSKSISTEHILLGLLHDETGLARQILREYDLDLDSVREHLKKHRHAPSLAQNYEEPPEGVPPEIAETLAKLRDVVRKMEQAVADRDFGKARAYSDEERVERAGLRALCEKHGLESWRFRL